MPARIVPATLAAGAAAFGIAFAVGQQTRDEPGAPPAFGVPAVPLDVEGSAAAAAKPVSLGGAAKLPAQARGRKPAIRANAPAQAPATPAAPAPAPAAAPSPAPAPPRAPAPVPAPAPAPAPAPSPAPPEPPVDFHSSG